MFRSTLAALCAVAIPAAAYAEGDLQTIEVEGIAAVVNNDVGAARDRAVDDAKRKAVEQVMGAAVKAESTVQNNQLVEDKIISRASGFVKSYEIKSQFKDGDNYHVKIKAVVDAGKIADEVSQVTGVKPRVIIMIAEQNVGATSYAYWWGQRSFTSAMDIMQTQIINGWGAKGFKFVEPSVLKGKLKVTSAMKDPELDDSEAFSIARDADADIAIVGKVMVTDGGPVMEGQRMRSFHAVGNLKVLNVDTGEIITAMDESAVSPHIDGNTGGRNAIKALAEKLSEPMQKAILGKWTAEAAGASTIEVTVEGVAKPAMLRELTKFLTTEVRGVEKVDERRRKGKTAMLDVHYRGGGMELGKSLEDKTFEGYAIDVTGMTKTKVTIELTSTAGK